MSPLGGRDLIQEKVQFLSLMAGNFKGDAERWKNHTGGSGGVQI